MRNPFKRDRTLIDVLEDFKRLNADAKSPDPLDSAYFGLLDPDGVNVIQLTERMTDQQFEDLRARWHAHAAGYRAMIVDSRIETYVLSEDDLAQVGYFRKPAPCVVYFALVSREGREEPELYVEPVRVESREPVGWEPDLCCDRMAEAYPHRDPALNSYRNGFIRVGWFTYGQDSSRVFGPYIDVRDDGGYSFMRGGQFPLERCPFCGADVILVQHCDLVERKETITVPAREYTGHYYEEASNG